MPHRDWLTAELAVMISKHLDFKSFLRLLSSSKLTHGALLPSRAGVIFPHAVAHMAALIKREREEVEDPGFVIGRVFDSGAVLRSSCGGFETVFGVGGCKNKEDEIQIWVNRYRLMLLPESVERHRVKLGMSRARVLPSRDRPFAAGEIHLTSWRGDENGLQQKQLPECPAIVYTDGFHAILRALVCDMCPLAHQD
jgi:hypothetical protein